MSICLKSCPKCHGDLFIEYDVDSGQSWSCLQCGWRCEITKAPADYETLLGEDNNMLKFERKRTRLPGEPIKSEKRYKKTYTAAKAKW